MWLDPSFLRSAGEVPETHHVGHWTANARALQAAVGGCELMRWVCPTLHFVCCLARRRNRRRHGAGCVPRKRLAHPPLEVRERVRRPRTLEGVVRTTDSHGHAESRKRRPSSAASTLQHGCIPVRTPAATGRCRVARKLSIKGPQVASWNIGLGRFYYTSPPPNAVRTSADSTSLSHDFPLDPTWRAYPIPTVQGHS